MSTCLSPRDFDAPITDRWWEDYAVGSTYEYGFASVSQDEIIDFARRYDPQPIHVDPAFAASGPYKGIIGSGVHTLALTMGLLVRHYISHNASLGSPGLDELRWVAPLRPEERLWISTEILDARPSASKGDRGILRTRVSTLSESGGEIMTLTATNFMLRRPAS